MRTATAVRPVYSDGEKFPHLDRPCISVYDALNAAVGPSMRLGVAFDNPLCPSMAHSLTMVMVGNRYGITAIPLALKFFFGAPIYGLVAVTWVAVPAGLMEMLSSAFHADTGFPL